MCILFIIVIFVKMLICYIMEDKLKVIEEMKPGENSYIEGDLQEIRDACAKIGDFLVSMISPTMCKVQRIKSSEPSDRQKVIDILDGYKKGKVPVKVPTAYVRVIVSGYNKQNGTKFKVSSKGALESVIFLDGYDRLELTKDEFEKYERDMLLQIERMRVRIVKPVQEWDEELM